MLICKKCCSEHLFVINSRRDKETKEYVYRRRECANCGFRFSTIEVDYEAYCKFVEVDKKYNNLVELLKNLTTKEMGDEK